MTDLGWKVVECPSEADVEIAKNIGVDDVVVSRDSDFFIYSTVPTIWQPAGQGSRLRIHCYHIPQILEQLSLSRAQLTALGVVTTNDYNKNLRQFGAATNYKLIKDDVDDSEDPNDIIDGYFSLRSIKLSLAGESFKESIKVFIELRQTLISSSDATLTMPNDLDYYNLREEFNASCSMAKERQMQQQQKRSKEKKMQPHEQRHKPKQHFNPFRTITSSNDRTRHRHKTRGEPEKHPLPEIMLQYEQKPWKHPPNHFDTEPTVSEKTSSGLRAILSKGFPQRGENLKALEHEHPTVSLELGSLRRNIYAALPEDQEVAGVILDCLRQAVRDANIVKRRFQQIVGKFVERTVASAVSQQDRELLDHLCVRAVKPGVPGNGPGVQKSKVDLFFHSILRSLYTGNELEATIPRKFWDRLKVLGILEEDFTPTVSRTRGYQPDGITRCIATQLRVQLQKHYKNGSFDLQTKLARMQKTGKINPKTSIEIKDNLSAIENFVFLNRIGGNTWKLIPLSSAEDGFVTFTEYEFGTFFCNHPSAYHLMDAMSKVSFPSDDSWRLTPKGLLLDWMPRADFGILIARFIAPLGVEQTNLSARRRGKLGYIGAIQLPTHNAVREHINRLRDKNFDPRNYLTKDYFLRGSVRTDGHRLQLLGFKLRELFSVKFKRFRERLLPDRLFSTTHGTDDPLTEARNVFRTAQDVEDKLGCTPNQVRERVKVLGIDLGQTCVVGATVLRSTLPKRRKRRGKRGGNRKGKKRRRRRKRLHTQEISDIAASIDDLEQQQPKYFNLVAKQKSIYQPHFRFRSWMNRRKEHEWKKRGEGGSYTSIGQIESSLPPLRGQDANLNRHFEHLSEFKPYLDRFYNGSGKFKRQNWFAKKAMKEEYRLLADGLLRMVDGRTGEMKGEKNKVIIGLGLGDFSSQGKLPSLHGSFQSYFIKLARSLGYLVVGVNEYLTSKKCPECFQYVAQTESIRRLYCSICQKYIHRDILGANNIANVLLGHLEEQERPDYLHPKAADGSSPWKQEPRYKRGALTEDEGHRKTRRLD